MIDDKILGKRALCELFDKVTGPIAVVRPDDPSIVLRFAEEAAAAGEGDIDVVLGLQPYTFVGLLGKGHQGDPLDAYVVHPKTREKIEPANAGDSFIGYDAFMHERPIGTRLRF